MRMMKSKKGAISDVLIDFVSYAVFAIIILVFFILFKASAEAKTLQTAKNEVTSVSFPSVAGQQFLLDYLRKSVYLPNEAPMNMADFITISFEKGDRASLENLKTEIKRDFDKYMKTFKVECYVFDISDGKNPIKIFDNPGHPTLTSTENPTSAICHSTASNLASSYSVILPKSDGTFIYLDLMVTRK